MDNKLIISLGIAVILVGGYLVYSGYEYETVTTAFAGWIAIIGGALLLFFGFARRSAEVMAPAQAHLERQEHSRLEISALVKSMATMASADGMVAEQEIETIGEIYEKLLGTKINSTDVQKVVADVSSTSSVLKELETQRSGISPLMKRKIVQASYLVMVSDLNVTRTEDNSLHKIGNALGFANDEIDDITAVAGT